MRAAYFLVVGLASVLTGCAQFERTIPEANGSLDARVRQILVTAHQQTSGALALVGDPDTRYLRRRGYGPDARVDRLLDELAEQYEMRRVRGWQITSIDVYCEVYEVHMDRDVDAILREIAADPRVADVQVMNYFQTQALHYNDPYAPMQTAIGILALESAHEVATGRGVTVAVVDSRVDAAHPELSGRVRPSRNFVVEAHRNAAAEVHGTAVAGIIASMANNAEGIIGAAPDVDIASLRACRTIDASTGAARCSSFSLARALDEAIAEGVRIVNLSLAGPSDPLVASLIDAALAHRIVVVAAMPDSDDTKISFPASYPGVIAVASEASPASLGQSNLLIAPGREILSTVPRAGYGFFSGNSMAAAYVSGVAALLVEREPEIESREVFRLLTETSTERSINACRALARISRIDDCDAMGNARADAE